MGAASASAKGRRRGPDCSGAARARLHPQVLAAREHQVELWTELSLATPSQRKLDTIGQAVRKAIRGADAAFTRILRLNPNAVPVMRRYAQFLEEVRGWGV